MQTIDGSAASIPYGKPLPNQTVWVYDSALRACPDHVKGRIYIGGMGLAIGYWRDAERTAERFRPAPEESEYGGVAAWSGDRVKRDKEGLLYFLGRRDSMIKTAGNRISPQEIETAALASGLLVEAVALGVPDPQLGQKVVLVVRGNERTDASREALSDYLQRQLPNFMQPREVRWLEKLPLNPHGKTDRLALKKMFVA